MYILDKLWEGEIAPCEIPARRTKEYREAAARLMDTDERLRQTLAPPQLELLEASQMARDNLSYEELQSTFRYAFCLGAGIILDVVNVPEDE